MVKYFCAKRLPVGFKWAVVMLSLGVMICTTSNYYELSSQRDNAIGRVTKHSSAQINDNRTTQDDDQLRLPEGFAVNTNETKGDSVSASPEEMDNHPVRLPEGFHVGTGETKDDSSVSESIETTEVHPVSVPEGLSIGVNKTKGNDVSASQVGLPEGFDVNTNETKDDSVSESSVPVQNDDKRKLMYSWGRHDRSGSFIRDMILAHAHAFHNNISYGGVCCCDDLGFIPGSLHQHLDLIEGLGLADQLKFACPWDDDDEQHGDDNNEPSGNDTFAVRLESSSCPPDHKVYARDSLTWDDQDFFVAGNKAYHGDSHLNALEDKEYLSYLQSLVNYPRHTEELNKTEEGSVLHIAVHIRRGDISPCGKFAFRYYSNRYYMELLQELVPEEEESGRTVQVTVYSEESSFEPWDVFLRANYTLRLGGSVVDAWRRMIEADIFIMSRSAFSTVPAMLNRNGRIVWPDQKRFEVLREADRLCKEGRPN